MQRPLAAALLALTAFTLHAQTPAPTTAPTTAQNATQSDTPPPGTAVLHAGTQLVVVDVNVQDARGNPIHDLKATDFTLTEDKVPQAIRNFDAHSAAAVPATIPPMPKLPPGTFTNYTPVPPDSTLNILLLDTLNTPIADQMFVRNQLQNYVKHIKPGTRIAIIGLANHLYFLQGFTSDPELLKSIVDHNNTKSSMLLDADSDGSDIAETFSNFETESTALRLRERSEDTLDAFNSLAHYLANFPGRKNLIWFSGSFPFDFTANPNIGDLALASILDDELRQTTNLLTRAQVAVYPVDARGLMTIPTFSAANAGHSYGKNPGSFTTQIGKFYTSQANEHETMMRMAEGTGGHAFYNTNDLSKAVAQAIDLGANYYTLTYSPSNRKWNGAYRNIGVKLTDEAKARGLILTYRHGYYADDPDDTKHNLEAATVSVAATTATHSAQAYAANAMARGAPTPQDMLLKVAVYPASPGTTDKLAPGNVADPVKPFKAPYRDYVIDFGALSSQVTLTPGPDGKRTGALEFIAFVYDADGALINTLSSTVDIGLTPEGYKNFLQHSLLYRFQISAPAKKESYLRIAIHDVPSNHFGVVEIPTNAVASLPPLAQAPPPTTPKPGASAPPVTPTN